MIFRENPLVSIIVITYNSSKFVLETLESAKNQSYQNLELIISDDHSIDNTVELCNKWIVDNKGRFVNTKLITVEKNTGISPNCNRGLFVANGKWVKFIAGDDILLENCILEYITATKENNCSFYFGKMKYNVPNASLSLHFEKGFELFKKESNQFKLLLKENYIPAPSAFILKKTLQRLNGFDERFPMLEDYPLWIRASKNKFKMKILEKEKVMYRIHENSISMGGQLEKNNSFYFGNLIYLKSWYKFKQSILKDQLNNKLLLYAIDNFVEICQFKLVMIFNNKKSWKSNLLYKLLTIFRPFFYYNLLKK